MTGEDHGIMAGDMCQLKNTISNIPKSNLNIVCSLLCRNSDFHILNLTLNLKAILTGGFFEIAVIFSLSFLCCISK